MHLPFTHHEVPAAANPALGAEMTSRDDVTAAMALEAGQSGPVTITGAEQVGLPSTSEAPANVAASEAPVDSSLSETPEASVEVAPTDPSTTPPPAIV